MCFICLFGVFVFFFFKQKTAYEMRISDWSSDVCSSDLFTVIGGVDPRLNESEKRGFLLGHAANGLGREPGAAAPLRRRDPIDEIERVGVDPCGADRGLAHVSNVYIRYAAVNPAGSRPRLAGAADLPFVGGQPFERDRAVRKSHRLNSRH